jgi:cytochrome c biogenesis protein CcmG/thiol:disulfide interchange protein DsbE
MKRFFIPLGIFFVVVIFLGIGLTLKPREVPSPLIGKPAPEFLLPHLQDPKKMFSPKDLIGQVWLLNVWASWCGGCREEHPLLLQLAKNEEIPLYGVDYKDRRDEALGWLKQRGNPYVVTVMDESGRVGSDYGVYGVPETYLVDKGGVIRFKQIGILDHDTWHATLRPLIKELQRQ